MHFRWVFIFGGGCSTSTQNTSGIFARYDKTSTHGNSECWPISCNALISTQPQLCSNQNTKNVMKNEEWHRRNSSNTSSNKITSKMTLAVSSTSRFFAHLSLKPIEISRFLQHLIALYNTGQHITCPFRDQEAAGSSPATPTIENR